MPKYRVLEKSFINDQIVEEGSIIDFDPGEGQVSANLELIKGKKSSTQVDPPVDPEGGDPTDPA